MQFSHSTDGNIPDGEATVIFSEPSGSPGGLVPAAAATVTARRRSQLDAETRDLLRLRLRAVAIVFLVGTFAFAIRGMLIGPTDRVILVDQLFLEPALIGLILVLSRPRSMSLRTLRGLELAVFGLMIAHSVVVHWRMMLNLSRANDPIGVQAVLRSVVLTTFALTVTYGFFVPNTWRRAMIVVVGFAAVPLLTGLIMCAIHPEIRDVLTPLLTPIEVSDDLLMMTIGVITAVIGAKVVHSLRKESFDARQLNQYQLGTRLAVGGMGEVYLAEHRLLKRPCAIKLIRPGQDADPKVIERFEREVRQTARLSHPNTIEIYDYGRAADGSFYYVMEYLPGLSFDELVRRFGPLPAGRVIYLLRQACAALAEAHGAGLVHRDIKPANLFAAKRGGLDDFVKLLDFGLVKPIKPLDAELSQDVAIAGTPLYMAPEQARGDSGMDARRDIYGLGAVGYYLLTGHPPFAGANSVMVIAALLRDEPPPLSRLQPDIPDDLERVILQCLAKSPGDRFQSAADLDSALASCRAAEQWNAQKAAEWWCETERTDHGAVCTNEPVTVRNVRPPDERRHVIEQAPRDRPPTGVP